MLITLRAYRVKLRHSGRVNLLIPNIRKQILLTDPHTFPLRIIGENLIKDQSIFPFVNILLILTTLSLDHVLKILYTRKLMLATLGT